MKLLNNKIIANYGSKYLEFEFNGIENHWMTSIRLEKLYDNVWEICGAEYIFQRPPVPVLTFEPNANDESKTLITVVHPVKEILIKAVLEQFIKLNFISLSEGNNMFKEVSNILGTELTPLDPNSNLVIKGSQFQTSNSSVLPKNTIFTSQTNTQPPKKEDTLGNSLKGLRGAFSK